MARNSNTLDLCGDLDDVEMLIDVEETFGFKIANHDAEALYTVGDLADLIEKGHQPARGAPCLSARGFRRLRKVLPTGARPTSRLSEFFGSDKPRVYLKKLSRTTGLKFKIDEYNEWQSSDAETVFAGVCGAALFLSFAGQYFVAALFLTTAMHLWMTYRRPLVKLEQMSLADLIDGTIGQNYRTLRGGAPTGTRTDIWKALCDICRTHACYAGHIDRNTTFFSNVSTLDQPGKD